MTITAANPASVTAHDLKNAIPTLDGVLDVPGLEADVWVWRDEWGIPHVRAANEHDAWFAQGFVTAQDRLWAMEFDRLRAVGRWAEAAGESAVGQGRADAPAPAGGCGAGRLRGSRASGQGDAGSLRGRRQRVHQQRRATAGRIRHLRHRTGAVGAVAQPGGFQGAPHLHGRVRDQGMAGQAGEGAGRGTRGRAVPVVPAGSAGDHPHRRRLRRRRGPRPGATAGTRREPEPHRRDGQRLQLVGHWAGAHRHRQGAAGRRQPSGPGYPQRLITRTIWLATPSTWWATPSPACPAFHTLATTSGWPGA